MIGTFQQSRLRIEVDATAGQIQASLIQPDQFRQWLWPQQFEAGLPESLQAHSVFRSYFGPVEIRHEVQSLTPNHLRLMLSGGIDGCQEWYWGDRWVQSDLVGISALPISLGQSLVMMRLGQFLAASPEPPRP
ncbi:MAG: hypothetical protein VKI82_05935 [Leptolyngbya sp.]|nr:hypothetical protein [Leptolyngbya sp.]